MRKKQLITLFALICIAALAGAQNKPLTLAMSTGVPTVDGVIGADEYSAVLDLTRVKVSMSRSADALSIGITAPTKGWVAIGLGSNRMAGATIFISYVADGKLQLKIQRGTDHSHADLTSDALLASAGKEDGTNTTIELKLKPSAFIAKDQTELVGIVAIGNADSFFAMHSFRATWTAKLTN